MAVGLVIFFSVYVVEVLERLFELVLSKYNSKQVLARGGIVINHPIHQVVVISHIVWLVAIPLEIYFFKPEFNATLASVCLVVLVFAMILRYWAVLTLGDRWNIRVITVPGEERITDGPFHWFRHPNYIAVYAEYFALPLLHSAWFSAFILGTIGSLLIAAKTKVEDEALSNASFNSLEVGDLND